jgi:MoxR-like ATPase
MNAAADIIENGLKPIADQLGRVIRGKDAVIERLLVALCSDGHVLIEDVPGVGKTTLAKALARSVHGDFHRIQFTPDLLPTDILGGMIYSAKTGEFSFRPGPIFCNVLLADEINRASPRTQSALLEAMNERQVTIEGATHPLPEPFIVIATQNPVEHHGTYPLPEAQLDRFAMQLEMGYPQPEEEMEIVLRRREGNPLDDVSPVAEPAAIVAMQRRVRQIEVEDSILRYITALIQATREDARLELGASPRATLVMFRSSQALAFARGRTYVTPDDVKELARYVLAHRLALETKAKYSGTTKAAVIKDLLQKVPVPV